MTPRQPKTADKMTSVKAAWDTANTAKNDAETNKELDTAPHTFA